LVNAHRIIGAEDADGAAEPDLRGGSAGSGARRVTGAETGTERVRCSPKPEKSRPTSSARRTPSIRSAIDCAVDPKEPSGPSR